MIYMMEVVADPPFGSDILQILEVERNLAKRYGFQQQSGSKQQLS